MRLQFRLIPLWAALVLAACAGAGVEPPDNPVETQYGLTNWLTDRNYILQQTGFSAFEAEGERGNRFLVSGYGDGALYVWTFGSDGQAERALRDIRGGSRANSNSASRSFYVSGPLVVVYLGDDAGLRGDLSAVLGPPR